MNKTIKYSIIALVALIQFSNSSAGESRPVVVVDYVAYCAPERGTDSCKNDKVKAFMDEASQIIKRHGKNAHFGLVFLAGGLNSKFLLKSAGVIAIIDLLARTLPVARQKGFLGGGGTRAILKDCLGFHLRTLGAGLLGAMAGAIVTY